MPRKRTRFTAKLQAEFLEHIRAGKRRGATAEYLGFSRLAVMSFIETHPYFEKQVLDAEGEATEHVEEALYQAAVSGNVQAAKHWLELRGGKRGVGPLLGDTPPPPEEEPPAEPVDDEDDLFPANVTRMDPRARRRKST